MPLKDIQERTKARKEAGLNQTYQHPRPTSPDAVNKSAKVPLPQLRECANGGTDDDIIERCHTCGAAGRHTRECEVHKVCTHEPVNPGVMDCRTCQAEGKGFVAKISLTMAPR